MEKIELIHSEKNKMLKIFNSPVEIGIRALIILDKFSPRSLDFQRILYFDYLILNSGDYPKGPPSLHPKLPNRSSAVGIRRKDLTDGLDLLVSRDLVVRDFSAKEGVLFRSTDVAKVFLKYFSTQYHLDLSVRAQWIYESFAALPMNSLISTVETESGEWGVEFSKDLTSRNGWYK